MPNRRFVRHPGILRTCVRSEAATTTEDGFAAAVIERAEGAAGMGHRACRQQYSDNPIGSRRGASLHMTNASTVSRTA